MQLDVDLQRFLSFRLLCTVEQNKISEETSAAPCVTFMVKSSEQEPFMSGQLSIRTTEYDIEIYGQDVDGVDAIAEKARKLLNGYQGMMGFTQVLGGFVRDQDGNYVPKASLATDEGLHINSFIWSAMV